MADQPGEPFNIEALLAGLYDGEEGEAPQNVYVQQFDVGTDEGFRIAVTGPAPFRAVGVTVIFATDGDGKDVVIRGSRDASVVSRGDLAGHLEATAADLRRQESDDQMRRLALILRDAARPRNGEMN